MADQCDLCLLGLIILSSLLTGTSGVDDLHVFISSGENVHLSCNNALSDCKSTTWTYSRHSGAVELINGGKKKKDTERHERLSLGSDCSLNIKNVTEEDYGLYICQQYVNGEHQGTDEYVYLHVLHVSVSPSSSSSSSSSSQTEISPGHSVTLSCQLYSGFSCDYLVHYEGLQLLWVNQAGVDLKTDSRYQILFSSDHCIITLTTTLLNEDDNREWRCQLTLRNQLQTSVRYTVKYSGSSGVNDAHVFISSGENVRLPCNNALSDCKSTTWTYNRFTHSGTDSLIELGIKKKDTERHERLSLGSDCSLNIKNVTEEDSGLYTCQQYVNGEKQGTDERVYLHVLHVSVSPSSSSSSSSQTEISPGRSVTLSCQLYSYDLTCNDLVSYEGLQLLWVNQAGVDLTTDSRYQILFSSDHCIITLTTTLLNEDDNREWRCQLTLRNQSKTSVRYTVKYSVSSSNSEKKSSQTTAAAPTQENQKTLNTPNSERTAAAQTPGFTEQQVVTSTTSTLTPDVSPISLNPVVPSTTASTLTPTSLVIVIVVASFAVLLPALILWMIRRKRDDNRRGTDDSEEQTDDHVTYSEVTAYSKNQDQKKKVRCDDKVTYASIRGAKAGSQENCSELYASVNKNHHKSVK
ncbi:carcinoembryonic antigen-related cell adhesion molecule 5-like [Chanodichthys erythropterus]|uniref:carcinoembryonic antigen-related cell adhesion molecule 5-like n=1 Tax=Chanodichthys erythropterus TaxID=933992 RepID=UPI00351E2459